MSPTAWETCDGVVELRPPEPGDADALVAGRDAESVRWLGAGDEIPSPAACLLVKGEVVGWVDYDTDREWLKSREVNIGYSVFPAHRGRGYATRAVKLLVRHLSEATDTERAYLAIDAENLASLGVARAVGAAEVERYLNDEGRLTLRFVIAVPSTGRRR